MPTSNYRGVSFNKQMKKWISQYKKNGKNYYVGNFESEKWAALVHNIHIFLNDNLSTEEKNKLYNCIGEPTISQIEDFVIYEQKKRQIKDDLHKKQSLIFNSMRNENLAKKTKYKGVFWHKQKQRWRAIFIRNKKRLYLGQFKTPEEAAEAYSLAEQAYEKNANNNIEDKKCNDKQSKFLKFSANDVDLFNDLNLTEQNITNDEKELMDVLNETSLIEIEKQLDELTTKKEDDSFLSDIEYILNNPSPLFM